VRGQENLDTRSNSPRNRPKFHTVGVMRSFPSLVILCALALVGPAVASASAEDGVPTGQPMPDPTSPLAVVQGTHKPQTSDGVIGQVPDDDAWAPPPFARNRFDTTVLRTWQVVPGVDAVVWDEVTPRGPIHASLLTIKMSAANVSIDYGNAGPVKQTAPMKKIVRRNGAIAGVNGDFFDIGDTGAPLGVGRDRTRGLLSGRLSGWNSAFYVTKQGHVKIGPITVRTKVAGRPNLVITNYNSPSVQPQKIGLYTAAWGYTSGYRVTDGVRKGVRMALIRGGKVVRTSTKLPKGTKITGKMLIGRGKGAKQLAKLKRGMKVKLTTSVSKSPQMVITGNQFLLRDGLIDVVDDRVMHPRTAVGIDRDTRTVLLLVIDGRQDISRGYTMVELANKMIELGADEALNLDGGGSSTMVALNRKGTSTILNSPSGGVQRYVANGIVVKYHGG